MKVRVLPEEMVLEELLTLYKLESIEEQAKYYFEINGINWKIVDVEEQLKLYAMFLEEFNKAKEDIQEQDSIEIDGELYRLPNELTDIKVGYYIEAINFEPEKEMLNAHVVTACLFRKDHDKPFNEKEIIETATKLYSKDVKINIIGIKAMAKLLTLLKERYPILYKSTNGRYDDSPRKGYDMINVLANRDFTKWEQVKNYPLSRAMVYLESLAFEAEKQRNV